MGEQIHKVRLNRFQRHWKQVNPGWSLSSGMSFNTAGWSPAINAYRCNGSIRICVDLAGVEPSVIEIHARSRSILIRGHRILPEPGEHVPKPVRVLALEIDHGPFEREFVLEAEVEPSRVSTEQSNGLLWISLPLRAHG